jgi:thiamine pyrophosphate-dependent acetolactate synthase large subunit-like protein
MQWHRVCPRVASRRSRPATRASRSCTSTDSSPRSTTIAPIRVIDAAALDAALAEAVAHDGPAMVEVITDPNLV